jgi:endonuclease G
MLKYRWRILAIAIVVILFGFVACSILQPKEPKNPGILAAPSSSVHLKLGNPSNATDNPAASPNNFLLVKPQYVLSYNNSKRVPNWSSWELNQSWIGTLPRKNDFRPDSNLPKGWYQVTPADYNSSGYDRGHMTPSADRDNSLDNMSSTYLMTNILPQSPDNNQGPWAKLEQYCRDLAAQGKQLYIIAGGYGEKPAIGKGTAKIVPPARTWKVIVVADRPGAAITKDTRVIAIDMPNEQGIRDTDWRKFRVSVAALEAKTGYNFLSAVPADIQKTLENRVDAIAK